MYRSSDNGFEGIALEYQQMVALDTKRMADAVEKIAEVLVSIDARLSRGDRTETEVGDVHAEFRFPKDAKPGDIWPPYDH